MKPKNAVLFDRTIGRAFYRFHRWLYRMTGGRIGHRTPEGPVLLLTTIGRRTGKSRTHALLYVPDGERFIVVASNGGRPQPPAWLHNIRSNPEVEVHAGRRRLRARAEVLDGDAREEMWPRLKEHYRGWDHYQTLTERTIHPVVLTPLD